MDRDTARRHPLFVGTRFMLDNLIDAAPAKRKDPPNPKKSPIKEPNKNKKPIGDPPTKAPAHTLGTNAFDVVQGRASTFSGQSKDAVVKAMHRKRFALTARNWRARRCAYRVRCEPMPLIRRSMSP